MAARANAIHDCPTCAVHEIWVGGNLKIEFQGIPR